MLTGCTTGNFGEDLNSVNIRVWFSFAWILSNAVPIKTLYKAKPLRGRGLGERPGSNRRPLDPQTSALTS